MKPATEPTTVTVLFQCPQCEQSARVGPSAGDPRPACPHCGWTSAWSLPAATSGLSRCLICGGTDLFVRKDFPQRLGVGLVVVGFLLSGWAWYEHRIVLTFAILLLTALVDLVLFLTMGSLLECYRCHAQTRGMPIGDDPPLFDLQIYERYRQAAARQKMLAESDPRRKSAAASDPREERASSTTGS